jgi:SAM-dependent methyltransferase
MRRVPNHEKADMTDKLGYSGKRYWDEYHHEGLSKLLDRSGKQKKWLDSFVAALQECRARVVLDLGCGSGYDALQLARLGFEVSGVDISSIAIAHAKITAEENRLEIDYRQHDIARPLPYLDAHFDAVICNLTLHMFPVSTAAAITAEVARCLKPGGAFMLHVNSVDDLPYRSKLQPPVVELGDEMYCFGRGQTMRFFSEQACRDLLADWQLERLQAVRMLQPDGAVQKCAWRVIARKRAAA